MRRGTLVASIAGLALVAAACTPSVTVENQPLPTDGQPSGIVVSGVGKVTGTPDTLSMSFGVRVVEDSVSDAVDGAAVSADAVIAALEGSGVATEDIQTTNYAIYPQYDWRNDRQILLGYEVTNTVTAKIRDIASAGTTIDAVAAAAGDDVTVSGVSFSIEDNEELLAAARQAAWDDAEAKAGQLAELGGVTLGAPVTISESFSSSRPPIAFDDLAVSEAAGLDVITPITPGQQEVAVNLEVQFSIDG
jgi:uncharacterized protein YggE